MITTSYPLATLADTAKLAKDLASHLKSTDLIALSGDLGSGKTAFARALIHALGVNHDVPSPTFTLLQSYDGSQFPIFHFDLYRLNNENELEEIGWDEALHSGLVIVEWPEKAGHSMPPPSLHLHFTLSGSGRMCRITRPEQSSAGPS